MEVRKEILQDLAYDPECEDFVVVKDTHTGSSRWSQHYRQILKHKESGKFYVTDYSLGSTESQDESPYEYEPDVIKLTEVVPFKRTVTDYKEAA